jgi:hypothetical protein
MLGSVRIQRKMDKLTSYNVTETFDGRLVGGVYLLHIKMLSGLFRPSSLRGFPGTAAIDFLSPEDQRIATAGPS